MNTEKELANVPDTCYFSPRQPTSNITHLTIHVSLLKQISFRVKRKVYATLFKTLPGRKGIHLFSTVMQCDQQGIKCLLFAFGLFVFHRCSSFDFILWEILLQERGPQREGRWSTGAQTISIVVFSNLRNGAPEEHAMEPWSTAILPLGARSGAHQNMPLRSLRVPQEIWKL